MSMRAAVLGHTLLVVYLQVSCTAGRPGQEPASVPLMHPAQCRWPWWKGRNCARSRRPRPSPRAYLRIGECSQGPSARAVCASRSPAPRQRVAPLPCVTKGPDRLRQSYSVPGPYLSASGSPQAMGRIVAHFLPPRTSCGLPFSSGSSVCARPRREERKQLHRDGTSSGVTLPVVQRIPSPSSGGVRRARPEPLRTRSGGEPSRWAEAEYGRPEPGRE
jgi:hypothetical protein